MPTRTFARQFLQEGLGRLLRRHQPVGLDVGGAHAARHVHGQHDGALEGSVTTANGRARPAAGRPAPAASAAAARGGASRGPCPAASGHDRQAGQAHGQVLRRRSSHRYSSTSSGNSSSSHRNWGHRKSCGTPRATSGSRAVGFMAGKFCAQAALRRWRGKARPAARRALAAQVGEAHDGVRPGRRRWPAPACPRRRAPAPAQVGLALLRRCGGEALAKAAGRWCPPAAARRSRRRAPSPGPGRAVPSPAGRTGARPPPRGAGQRASGLPAGALMKSDTTNTSERRGRCRRPSSAGRPGGAGAAGGCRARAVCACAAAGAARAGGRCARGSTVSTLVP
jgi:hypothetical protein